MTGKSWKPEARNSCSTGEEREERRMRRVHFFFIKNSVWVYFMPEQSGDEKNGQPLGIQTSNKIATRLADIRDEILLYFNKSQSMEESDVHKPLNSISVLKEAAETQI